MDLEPILPWLVLVRVADEDRRPGADLALDPRGEVLERRKLDRGGGPALGIGHAQGAYQLVVRIGEGHAGVEPQVGLAGDQRMVGQAIVHGSVGDDHRLPLEHGEPAQGPIAGQPRLQLAHLRLEPQTVTADDRHPGQRNRESLREPVAQPIEARLARRVEDLAGAERLDTGLFVTHSRARAFSSSSGQGSAGVVESSGSVFQMRLPQSSAARLAAVGAARPAAHPLRSSAARAPAPAVRRLPHPRRLRGRRAPGIADSGTPRAS